MKVGDRNMKKILLLGLSLSLMGAPLLVASLQKPQQSIFVDTFAYDCVSIDTDKMVKVNAIISPLYQDDLYHLLRNIWITKENILNLVNNRFNASGRVLTSVKDLHIGEILKIQKNILIRKNHRLVMDSGPFMGDNAAQDYSAFALFGSLLTYAITQANPKDPSLSHFATVGFFSAFTLGSLYKVYKIYKHVRGNESLIHEIDEMIEQLEKIEAEEMENA